MKSLSSVGLGLSLVFGCLLLALVAELYYLLWWKKRFITNREIEDDRYSSPARELLYMFCWKRPSSLSSTALNPQEICSTVRISDTHVHEPEARQLHLNSNKEFLLKPLGDQGGVETELRRLHDLSGPPRFLFTIKEETKEDLESEDGKSRKGSRSRSLSDLLLTVETPFLTPLSSPPFFTPPLTPMESSNNHHGFNPLFESSTDAKFDKIKSSPSPKFKFLQDAEEKLYRRKLMEEEAEKGVQKIDDGCVQDDHGVNKGPSSSKLIKDEEDGSFITIIVPRNKERELNHHHHFPQHHSSSSQVIPLASSPSTFRPPANKKPILHRAP